MATAIAFLQSTFANDYDTLLSLVGEDFTLIDHPERRTYRTEAEHAEAIAADVVWAERQFELQHGMETTDGAVVLQYVETARHVGRFHGIDPTGTVITNDVCNVFRFDANGRIIEMEIYEDLLDVLHELRNTTQQPRTCPNPPRRAAWAIVAEPDLREIVLTRESGSDGRISFTAEISDAWTIMHVFGGVAMYITLQGMIEALERSDLAPATATALFLTPVPAGRVVIDVDVLRMGRSTAQLVARLRVAGSEDVAVHVQAVFGVERADPTVETVTPPAVPLPSDVPTRRHELDMHVNMDDRTEWRPISGFADDDRGKVLAWERLRSGLPDVAALAVHGDILGGAVGQYGYTILSLEIAIRFIAQPATSWVLQDTEPWHIGGGYASGPARLWDEHGRLCAIVTQTAQVR